MIKTFKTEAEASAAAREKTKQLWRAAPKQVRIPDSRDADDSGLVWVVVVTDYGKEIYLHKSGYFKEGF